MNANELADKLQMDKARALLYVNTVVEAATMLRQQQAEIEALKTHPVKELTLTDEEIMQEWTWKYSDTHEDFLLKFARAILGKAQEK